MSLKWDEREFKRTNQLEQYKKTQMSGKITPFRDQGRQSIDRLYYRHSLNLGILSESRIPEFTDSKVSSSVPICRNRNIEFIKLTNKKICPSERNK